MHGDDGETGQGRRLPVAMRVYSGTWEPGRWHVLHEDETLNDSGHADAGFPHPGLYQLQ